MKKRLGAAVLDDFLDKSRYVTSKQIQSLRIMVSTATTFISLAQSCLHVSSSLACIITVCVCVCVCVWRGTEWVGGWEADLDLVPVSNPD